MKLNNLTRLAALGLALSMTTALAGCSNAASESTAASEEATSEAAASEAATDETAEDAYAYLADFSFSAPFDDKGYLANVNVADYVTLQDGYDDITLEESLGVVTEDALNEYISTNVLSQFTETEQVTDRAAADGDTVNIDYVGSIDGVEFEGGNSGGTGYDLTLGSGQFIDGFEDQIVGHTPGETFDVVVTFPEDYGSTDLAGKEAVFETTLNYINNEVTPELTDEWVASNLKDSMGFEDVASLSSFVNDTMLFDQQSNEVYAAVLEKATIADELPQEVLDYYRDMMLYTAYQYAAPYGMTVEDMLTASGYESVDAYLTSIESTIDSGARQLLLMQAVAEDKGIACDDDTLNADFARYYGASNLDSYLESYGENYLKMNMVQNLTMQNLIDNVKYAAAAESTAQ